MFAEKVTRVAYWTELGLYIEPGYTIRTHITPFDRFAADLQSTIRNGERADVEPGVFVAVRRASDDLVAGMVVCDLWGRWRWISSVLPQALQGESDGGATSAKVQFRADK